MNRRVRSIRALGYLIVSMTATAAALHWLGPVLAKSNPGLSDHEIVQRIQTGVWSGLADRPVTWRAIEILDEGNRFPNGTLAAISGSELPAHFEIHPNGQCFVSCRWRLQQPAPNEENVVQIRMLPSSFDSSPATSAQCSALRALVHELQSATSGNAMPLLSGSSHTTDCRLLPESTLISLSAVLGVAQTRGR